jgi:hypothetical protein
MMEGSIGSITSRNYEPTLSSHHPTRSVAVRGSNREQGTLEGGSSSNKKMTKGISTKKGTRFFLREKEADLDNGAQENEQRRRKGTRRGKRRRTSMGKTELCHGCLYRKN